MPIKDPARLGLESVMDAMTDGWHSKQIAIRDHCETMTQYSDENGEEYEVYKFKKGFDASKYQWTDQEKIARRRDRPARARNGDEAAASEPETSSDDETGSDYDISATENASIALTNGDYDTAAVGFDAVLAADPNNTAALSAYGGLLLAQQRDMPRAEAMLRRALAVDANDTSALVHLAIVLVRLKVSSARSQLLVARATTGAASGEAEEEPKGREAAGRVTAGRARSEERQRWRRRRWRLRQ